MELSETLSDICKICKSPAHGLHFGVMTCRACAAFFRRTIVDNRENKYLCRRDDNSCSINPDDRYHCKSCRFKKCISLNMTPENVQRHRDSFKSSRPKSKSYKIPSVVLKVRSKTIKRKRVIDVSSTKREICRLLNNTLHPTETQGFNKLELAEYALRQWRKRQKPETEMKLLIELPIKKLFDFFKKQMFVVAQWLSYSSDFQRLAEDERYQFFKLVWNIWRKFERYQISLEIFGEEAITDAKFALDDQHIVTSSLQLKFSEISDERDEKLTECFCDAWRNMFAEIAKPLQELSPTSTEMAFMLSELCWQIAGKSLQGDVLDLSEKVRDELADNLHNYYKGTHLNYAGRLIKLTKIVNSLIKFHAELKNRMAIVRIFDVFNVDLSEPDLYDL
ncbi:hypothetical protein L3Y34_007379 [Caenorhabditis briggsae]|uniref:Nuclear Hormone Receptor family n=1 Tax=Caenorhabditis briggsae TaxID=6238 RepID=A0AAE9A6L7_CAEBR|nr:hypothetical protein L3Y34_007379 [Caenorhabditis briggsae]